MEAANSTRNVDTVELFPRHTPIPTVTVDTYLRQVASSILAYLLKPPSHIPGLSYGNLNTTSFIQVSQILRRATA